MKVILLAGGLGTRLAEFTEVIPKPMVPIGGKPILWHIMQTYAHFGHKDFILCLGYRGDIIKKYFLNYDECISNDFVISNGGKDIKLYNSDIGDWTITFVDTGLNSNIGQRLKSVQHYLANEEVFMANYADGLTDLYLPRYLNHFVDHNKTASFLCVKSSQSFHVVSMADGNLVTEIAPVGKTGLWINGGFFIFKNEIFNYIQDGEELVQEPFQRLIDQKELIAYKHEGFWACMDTFKEKQLFDDMEAKGISPWAVWKPAYKNAQSK